MSQRVTIPEFKALLKDFGYPVSTVTRKSAKEVAAWYDVCIPSTLYNNKVSHGVFKLAGAVAKNVDHVFYAETRKPKVNKKAKAEKTKPVVAELVLEPTPILIENKKDIETKINDIASNHAPNYYVPKKDPYYIKWSSLHNDLTDIAKSRRFYPVYITGLSGNGKTLTTEQVGAEQNREVIIVNFTEETSEDDLLGSFRLINGDTVWEDGPVVVALKRGAILVLDEVDLGGARTMTLQSILSGKGVHIKKINVFVEPTEGFTVVATGNTKGKGDNGHGFINTNLMNEAMLDRFAATFEQDYPSIPDEVRILKRAYRVMEGSIAQKDDITFFDSIAKTGSMIRENYHDGGIESILSTRRLVDMVKSYIIFGKNRTKSFELCTARFDEETSGAMRDLYSAVDSGAHDNDGQPDELSPMN